MSIDANRVRDWFQSNRPDFPEEDIESLLVFSKSTGARKSASWNKVKEEIWPNMYEQGGGVINSTKAYQAAAQELGSKYKESSARNQFSAWCRQRELDKIGRKGKSYDYGRRHPKMKVIEEQIQSKDDVDVSLILKDHPKLVSEAQDYLTKNGYHYDRQIRKWRYKG